MQKYSPTQTYNENDTRDIFVEGRARGLTRAAPTSATDVLASDKKGDFVNDGTYEYKLVETSVGVLKWDRRLLSVGW